jgi:hypothetical protein
MSGMDSQDVPHGRKMEILQHLRHTGCRFQGDHLDLDQMTLKDMRGTIGRKVPWLFIEHTVKYVQTLVKSENVSMYVKGMLDGTIIIGRTFVVNVTETDGRLVFTIGWASEMQPFFIKTDGKQKKGVKRYKLVTKDHIVQFCNTAFAAPMVFPKSENYPKEWFVTMLVLQAAYHHDDLEDSVIIAAQDIVKKNRVISSPVVTKPIAPLMQEEQIEKKGNIH